jgi:hypothetical protein
MESPRSKKSSSKTKETKETKANAVLARLKTKKNKTNAASAAAANNPLTDAFFDVINVEAAAASKMQASRFASPTGKKKIEAEQVMSGIVDQNAFTTSKIQQLVSAGFITSKGIKASKKIKASNASNGINASKEIKDHVFSTFDKVILVDFENLWNVNQLQINPIINIINTINTTPSNANILFIFIMATYHRDNDLFTQIITSVDKSVSAECIYIDRNIDNLSEQTCIDKYGFNESDDYLLLKIFKYLSHFNIPVEILSADQYSYQKNIKIDYVYSSDAKKADIIKIDPFNPYEYYMQFYKAEAKANAKKVNTAKAKKVNTAKVNTIAAPMFLRITGEKKTVTDNNIVYYSNGSNYNKLTNKLTYNTGLVGSVAANGNIYMGNGMIEFANGNIQYSNGTLVYSFGKTIYINGTIQYPAGTVQYLNGIIEYPDKTLEYPNGIIEYPDNTLEYPNGVIKYKNGVIEYPNGVIEYPN